MNLLESQTMFFKSISRGWSSFWRSADPYMYAFPFSLSASEVLNNQSVDLKLDFDFSVYMIGLAANVDGDLTTRGIFSFNFKGSGGGIFFGNQNVRSDTFWSPESPYLVLRRPFTVAAKASLTMDLENLDAANAIVGQIAFLGYRGLPGDPQ